MRTPNEAYAAMLGAWKDAVGRLEGDVHDQIEDLAVLAARNADVEVLNLGARELRKKADALTGGHTYALALRAASPSSGAVPPPPTATPSSGPGSPPVRSPTAPSSTATR